MGEAVEQITEMGIGDDARDQVSIFCVEWSGGTTQ